MSAFILAVALLASVALLAPAESGISRDGPILDRFDHEITCDALPEGCIPVPGCAYGLGAGVDSAGSFWRVVPCGEPLTIQTV